MKIDCNDAIKFIEDKFNIKLLEFQKKAVKGFLEQKNVFMPRCSGMSTILRGLGDYFTFISDNPNYYDFGKYSKDDYDVIIGINDVLNERINQNTLLSRDLCKRHQAQNRKRFIQEFDILDQFEG